METSVKDKNPEIDYDESAGKHVTSEDALKTSATYAFDFNAGGFIIFPDLLHADGSMIVDRKGSKARTKAPPSMFFGCAFPNVPAIPASLWAILKMGKSW
jgi:hypothetical protein